MAAFFAAAATVFLSGSMTLKAENTGSGSVSSNTVQTPSNVDEVLHMLPGEERLLSISSEYGTVYSSTDPDMVFINGYGQMTAKKPGTCYVSKKEFSRTTVSKVVVGDTVDLVVFAGQSNMAGAGGNYQQAPLPETGTAYEFNCADSDKKKLIAMREPFGNGTNRAYILNGRYVSGNGTLTSAFAIQYYKKAKVPIVGVPAAWGGTSTNSWLKNTMLKTTISRLKKAKKYLKKNKIKIRHIYVVWYQGESDGQAGYSGETFTKNMKKIWKQFKSAGAEKLFMIKIAQQVNKMGIMNPIQEAQTKLCKKEKDFLMATTVASSMHQDVGKWYFDVIHINQKGLNVIGNKAGKYAGTYARNHSR